MSEHHDFVRQQEAFEKEVDIARRLAKLAKDIDGVMCRLLAGQASHVDYSSYPVNPANIEQYVYDQACRAVGISDAARHLGLKVLDE